MARKTRYREYLNAVKGVKSTSKDSHRDPTYGSVLKRLKDLKKAEEEANQQGGSNHE